VTAAKQRRGMARRNENGSFSTVGMGDLGNMQAMAREEPQQESTSEVARRERTGNENQAMPQWSRRYGQGHIFRHARPCARHSESPPLVRPRSPRGESPTMTSKGGSLLRRVDPDPERAYVAEAALVIPT
jgi:hypothetical protein